MNTIPQTDKQTGKQTDTQIDPAQAPIISTIEKQTKPLVLSAS